MFFCDNNSEYFHALKSRFGVLKKKNLVFLSGDYHSHLTNIIHALNKQKIYSFFFIDPYAMEFDWACMKDVLKIRSDIVFTFMSHSIYREVCSAKSRDTNNDKLDSFFGDNSWT